MRHGAKSWSVLLLALLATTFRAAEGADKLADFAERRDYQRLRALLDNRSDVNAAQPDGSTALHWAAYQDELEMARLLLEAGANPNARNRYGVTPLWIAASNGNGEMVALLLDSGADANQTSPGGETVLMMASRTGSLSAVKALLARGAEVSAQEPQYGQTALMWAAAEGHVPVVEALLAAGADFRTNTRLGFSALLFAVREGHLGVVRALLGAGADPNEVVTPTAAAKRADGGRGPRPGTSALILAVTNAHYEVASALLDAGADPNHSGPGYTALHAITHTRKPGGGDNDPPPQGSGSMTSLELVRKLAAKGANLNARMTRKINFGLTSLNTLGATPFLLAAKTADAELMRLLAELGADPTIPNADDSNAVIVAAGLGTRSPGEDAGTEEEVLEALQVALDLGLDINAVDRNGETAMHGAAYKNLPAVVEFLAKKGARIEVWNRPNKYGWTPLRIAEGYRFGNFKPSPPTVEAFHRVLKAAGAPIPTGGAGNLVNWR
ncbi:MAG: ankyrin repeat domain-containing protein [Bryobacteraceae bacterium]|nr:ankyrin repeat domain-containing protein [Bryobacteraceae bacterium]MDW8376681.1 ankyrin repeat domain-containing protein [Bryobacterales bacterium]